MSPTRIATRRAFCLERGAYFDTRMVRDLDAATQRLLQSETRIHRGVQASCMSRPNGCAEATGRTTDPVYRGILLPSARLRVRLCSHVGCDSMTDLLPTSLPPDLTYLMLGSS